jgi:hypothetical protein
LRPPSWPVAIVVADIVTVSRVVAVAVSCIVAVSGVVAVARSRIIAVPAVVPTDIVPANIVPANIVIVIARAFALPPGIIVDAGNLHRTAIGIDADGLPAIVEGVLGLSGAARQQKRGDSQKLFHNDLLCRESEPSMLRKGSSRNVIQITFK